ncbi:phospholipase D/nuclease [Pseudovirgaria hyperparasitica]|uniref:Phospholipase D/nuclease n=1 Tax=Pseudovirgaria hyperparasitica TaxID=470096 RepID=A0A6A6WAC5_9PEZI|nr:phospholipase D/nuclease [Pseudovirgaria hyperparasitica]KAF2759129.1 phospholipase D/nuclease [Pseudovirgaria hyperparasitica]
MSSSEDEEAQIERAIALSLQADIQSPDAGEKRRNTVEDVSKDQSWRQNQPTGAGLNLKELAAERNARSVKKRNLEPDIEIISTDSKGSKRRKAVIVDLSDTRDDNPASGRPPASPATPQNSMTSFAPGSFPKGVIKRTWAFGYDRSDDVKIEEVIQKNRIEDVVLSAFQIDLQWLLLKFAPIRSLITITMGLKDKKDQEQWRSDAKKNFQYIRLCFPDMSGQISSMHCKFIILFHGTHVRIVIPTANLMKYDWGETGAMENLVFMIDLPRLQSQQTNEEALPPFGQEFLYFLRRLGIDNDICQKLLKFDFTETKKFGFTHTVAGSHTDETVHRTGLPGLSHSIKRLSLQSSEKLTLDYASASLGSLDDQILECLYRSAMGQDITSKSSSSISSEHLRSKIRILFPSEGTVKSIKDGPESAGIITLQKQYWNSGKFPKACMREYKSIRNGLLSHNKLILARGEREGKAIAWAYLGSANFSESAWGKLVRDRATKIPKLNCRNWECGVVVPMSESALESIDKEADATVSSKVFETVFRLPFEHPGETYEGKSPWFFKEHHSDAHSWRT